MVTQRAIRLHTVDAGSARRHVEQAALLSRLDVVEASAFRLRELGKAASKVNDFLLLHDSKVLSHEASLLWGQLKEAKGRLQRAAKLPCEHDKPSFPLKSRPGDSLAQHLDFWGEADVVSSWVACKPKSWSPRPILSDPNWLHAYFDRGLVLIFSLRNEDLFLRPIIAAPSLDTTSCGPLLGLKAYPWVSRLSFGLGPFRYTTNTQPPQKASSPVNTKISLDIAYPHSIITAKH